MARTNLASLVTDFRRHGSQTAIVAYRGNRRNETTYADLADLAGRVASELDRRGIAPGERVVLWGENSAEWVAAFFACLLRGVIAVPLDAAGSEDFAARVIADVSPRLIIGDRILLRTLSGQSVLAFPDFDSFLPQEPLFAIDPSVCSETPMQIIFTSGTTSEPKGIVHSHQNVLAGLGPIESEIQKYKKYERLVHPLRFLHSLPLSHVFGQFMGLWVPALIAAEVHFAAQLDPANMVTMIRRERISVLAAVPRVLELMRAHLLRTNSSLASELSAAPEQRLWRRWWRFRRIHRELGLKFWAFVCGGASLPSDLESFWNTLGFALIQGYGLTETAALVTLNHPFRIGRGTIGRPLPGREIRLGDDGEILVRGEMLSSAIWKQGRLQHEERQWLATGDLATQDAAGQLRFRGRKGDVIVSQSGMNIHPSDLEEALSRQHGVRESVIVADPTRCRSEPVAVLLYQGTDEALKDAIRSANRQLADFQQIRRWLRWPNLSFPRTSTGKLLRREVIDWVRHECSVLLQDDLNQTSTSRPDLLLQLIEELSLEKYPGATDLSRLSEDLRLDSLGRVQLQSALEQRLGIDLPDSAFAQVETLGDLRVLTGLREEQIFPSPIRNQESSESTPAVGTAIPDVGSEHVYPHWPWAKGVEILRMLFLEIVLRPLVWLLAAPHINRDVANPCHPLLIIANHVTALDGALVLYALPRKIRHRVAIAMSGEMLLDLRTARGQANAFFDILGPVEYWLLTALFNVFPLPSASGFRGSFAHVGGALDHGYSVLVFPEGRRSKEGDMQAFRSGIGLLVQQSQVPVLPIALKGLGEIKKAKARWFRSGRLVIHTGELVAFHEYTAPNEITSKLEEILRRL